MIRKAGVGVNQTTTRSTRLVNRLLFHLPVVGPRRWPVFSTLRDGDYYVRVDWNRRANRGICEGSEGSNRRELPHRHLFLQFFEPVEDDVDLRRTGGVGSTVDYRESFPVKQPTGTMCGWSRSTGIWRGRAPGGSAASTRAESVGS